MKSVNSERPLVTFETKCWEKDWQIIMQPGRLEKIIADNDWDFAEKVLYINNVNDLAKVKAEAEKLKKQGVITSYVAVEEYADEALKFFGIDKESFGGGYYYSIQELVGIYLCKTPYLLHYSGDARPATKVDWVDAAIREMESDDRIKAASLMWKKRFSYLLEIKGNLVKEDDEFYINQSFSDQNYLISVPDFKKKIYNETHPMGDRYPRYGGNLFEKRVDAWMRNHGYWRATFKRGEYVHQNFEQTSRAQKLKQIPRKVRQLMVRFR